MMLKNIRLIITLLVVLFCADTAGAADRVVLVDFGGSEAGNAFELSGWNTVLRSGYSAYSNNGPAGIVRASGDTFDTYQGISGSARDFQYGERIIVTWYNSASNSITFRPIISFTDQNNPVDTDGEPQWYPMHDSITINAGETKETYYDFTQEPTLMGAVAATEGVYSVVNINENTASDGLICDKIELGQADLTPPTISGSIQATEITSNSISVSWEAATDNLTVEKYRIYVNGLLFGVSESNQYTIYNIQNDEYYAIEVTALDGAGNESDACSVNVKTEPIAASDSLIDPANIVYKGAFRLPSDTQNSSWAFRGGSPTYYPRTEGDPSPEDGYPGALFAAGHTSERYIAEIDIPAPIISASKDATELPQAQTIQHFSDVLFSGLPGYSWNYGTSLAYLPAQQGQTTGKLYTVFGNAYAVSGIKYADRGACELDLSNPNSRGGWYLGDSTQYHGNPPYNSTFRYMLEIPQQWADENVGGKILGAGGSRDGNYPKGPALYALAPWQDGAPLPEAGTELSYRTLLEYETLSGTHYLNGYNSSNWSGAAWLEMGGKSGVIFSGQKSYGEIWYGYDDGSDYNDFTELVPQPAEPQGHGPRSTSIKGIMLFYNPADFVAVAQDLKETYEPQPYAALDMSPYMFRDIINGLAYDRANGIIYAFEDRAWSTYDASPIVHVFKIEEADNPGPGDTTAPSNPTNLRVSAVSVSQIDLSWDPSIDDTGVAGYRIYRDGVGVSTTATTGYSDTGLSAGTSYTYTLTAYDAAGNESGQSRAAISATFSEGDGSEDETSSGDNTGGSGGGGGGCFISI